MALRPDSDRAQPLHALGARVRVLARGGLNTPRRGVVRRVVFPHRDRRWNYDLRCGERNVSKRYLAEDLEEDRGPD